MAIYQTNESLDPTAAQQLINHPIPHWVERMSICYLLAQEEKTWNEQIQQMAEVVPELVPLLLIRVENGTS
jgi:hypothetical protein